MKVLVGVDGSEGSLDAVSFVGPLLSAQQDQVALYYSPLDIQVREGGQTGKEVVGRTHKILAEAVFEEARQKLPAPLRTDVHTIVGQQHARHGIPAAAEHWRSEMIVVGSRGSGPIARRAMGSVANNVARASHVPVLIVRSGPEDRPSDGPADRYKVLLAHDGSEASLQTGEALHLFSWPEGTVGCTMTVAEPMFAGKIPPWLEQKVRDQATEAMAQAWAREHEGELHRKREELAVFAEQLPAAFRGVAPIVAEGHPAEQILRVIGENQIDLVAIGRSDRTALKRLLMGSTAETILTNAPCSILLVREREKP